MSPPRRTALAAIALVLLPATRLSAQDSSTPAPAPARNAVRTNLLGAVVGIYSVEYARAVGGPFALGIGGSYAGARFHDAVTEVTRWGWGRDLEWSRRAWAGAKLSFYSSDRPVLTGSSMALHAGAFAERGVDRRWRTRPTVGASYDFTHGERRRGRLAFSGGFRIEVVLKPARGGAALFIPIHLSSGVLF